MRVAGLTSARCRLRMMSGCRLQQHMHAVLPVQRAAGSGDPHGVRSLPEL